MIHLLSSRPTPQQFAEMLAALNSYIKLAVDVQREIVAGGGALHADCENVLLTAGSRQEDVWGADWVPSLQQVRYESLINIRPRQNNPSLVILDPALRTRVEEIVEPLLKGI